MSATPGYLDEAAAILLAAAALNRTRHASTLNLPDTHPVREQIRAESLRIAEGFTRLAAIERNLPPCCCRHAPEMHQRADADGENR